MIDFSMEDGKVIQSLTKSSQVMKKDSRREEERSLKLSDKPESLASMWIPSKQRKSYQSRTSDMRRRNSIGIRGSEESEEDKCEEWLVGWCLIHHKRFREDQLRKGCDVMRRKKG